MALGRKVHHIRGSVLLKETCKGRSVPYVNLFKYKAAVMFIGTQILKITRIRQHIHINHANIFMHTKQILNEI